MGALLNRRRYMGSGVVSPLPPSYKPIEYLGVESGNYYVDTGIITELSSTYRFVTKALFYSAGTRRQLNGNLYEPWFGCDQGKFNYSGSITPSTPTRNTRLSANTWYDIDVSSPSKNNVKHRLFIFTLCNPGATASPNSTYQCQMAFKICDIYDNGTLVRHLIPCRNPNNVEGMYDTVEGQFHALTSY